MDANEKNIANAIRRASESMEVPVSLEPDAVAARLRLLEEKESATQGAGRPCGERAAATDPVRPSRRRTRPRWLIPSVAAACLALLAGVGVVAFGASQVTTPDLASLAAPSASSQDEDATGAVDEGNAALEGAPVEALPTAASYDELYERLRLDEQARQRNGSDRYGAKDMGVMELSAELSADVSSSSQSKASDDFSATNVRTAGVDEADIVKTDGTCLYTMQNWGEEIAIVKTREGKMRALGSLKPREGRFCEFFLEGGRLYAVSEAYPEEEGFANPVTTVTTYDMSDPADPKLIAEVQQDGSYRTARLTDGYLYLFTTFYTSIAESRTDKRAYVPSAGGEALACADIYLPDNCAADGYLVVGSVAVEAADRIADQKAILCAVDNVYVSDDGIYAYGPVWNRAVLYGGVKDGDGLAVPEEDDAAAKTAGEEGGADGASAASETSDVAASTASSDRTALCKLSYGKGTIEAVGETEVTGLVDDSFSIDEYEGMTRVLTTRYGDDGNPASNYVSVLDENLKLVGELKDLAPGERIYSARLMGDIGYFVTYREVDPLFTVDFSDPTNPRIVGKLKIPGFSEYLHPFGEGRLLGIGMATEKGGSVTKGLKLSMLDTSDPTDVHEITSFTLEGAYWSDVFYDYRAVFVDVERGLVGFSIEGSDDCYCLFSYDVQRGGFREELAAEGAPWGYQGARGVRIGETFYVATEGRVTSFSLENFEKVGRLKLGE